MKGIVFKIIGWLLIMLAVCVLIVEGFLFLLSGWGICGDSVNCNPLTAVFGLHPNALGVIGYNVAFILAFISIILVAYGNFKIARGFERKEFSGKTIYVFATIGAFLGGILAISGFFEVIRSVVLLVIFNIVIFIISVYFVSKIRREL